MMREISFKVFSKKEKRFFDDFLDFFEDEGYYDYEEKWQPSKDINLNFLNKLLNSEDVICLNYIGKNDKNGINIYEKDVIKCKTKDNKDILVTVIFDEEECCYYAVEEYSENNRYKFNDIYDYEVLGSKLEYT